MAAITLTDVLKTHKETFWAENEKNQIKPDEIERRWRAEAQQHIATLLGTDPIQPANIEPQLQQPTIQSFTYNATLPLSLNVTKNSHLSNNYEYNTSASPVGPLSGAQPMSKKRSSQSGQGGAFTNSGSAGPPLAPLVVNDWQSKSDAPFSAFTAASPSPRPTKARKTATGCCPLQIPDVKELDPADYIKQTQNSLSPAYPHSPRPRRNSPQHLSPTSPLSRSPATSSSGFDTLPTSASVGMTRDDSIGGSSFCGPMQMMRLDSHRSDADALNKVEDSMPYSASLMSSSNNPNSDFSSTNLSLYVSHAQGADVSFSSTMPLVSNNIDLPLVVEDDNLMSRTLSSQSSDSSKSRVLRRSEEQAKLSTRPLKPKNNAESMLRQSSSSSSDCDMIRQRSADGKKVSIPKTKYTRPQHDKIKCTLCNVKPHGFRGPHELRRHMDNKHPGESVNQVRKVWICADRSPDQKFLSKCKHCLEKKKYGAYYNAAAHLRRIHWNPKEKGKKGSKTNASRGGNGGGDYPSMDILKLWIDEIDEPVTAQHPIQADSQSNEETLDDIDNDDIYDDSQPCDFDANDVSSSHDLDLAQRTEPQPQNFAHDESVLSPFDLPQAGDASAICSTTLPNNDLNAFPFSFNPNDYGGDIKSTCASSIAPFPSPTASQHVDSVTTKPTPAELQLASANAESIDMSLLSNMNALDSFDHFAFNSFDGFEFS